MSETADAVIFARSDYASLRRRIAAALVDIGVVFAILIVLSTVAMWLVVPPEVWKAPKSPQRQRSISRHMRPINAQLLGGWMALCGLYHVGLRRTRGGTLGYRLARVRIVDARGETPPWRALGKRFLLGTPTVPFFGISYLLCRQNPKRQAFHDQWSGTWVVRRNASPAGPARRSYRTKLFGTYMLTYVDLEPAEPEQAVEPSDQSP